MSECGHCGGSGWVGRFEDKIHCPDCDESGNANSGKLKRLQEQVDHLSQFAKCSRDGRDGIAHGGASVCQQCHNVLESRCKSLSEELEAANKRIGELEDVLREVEECRIFCRDSMDIDNYVTDGVRVALHGPSKETP